MATVYQTFPKLSQWKRDSSVFGATRANDPVLKRIDELVEQYNNASPWDTAGAW